MIWLAASTLCSQLSHSFNNLCRIPWGDFFFMVYCATTISCRFHLSLQATHNSFIFIGKHCAERDIVSRFTPRCFSLFISYFPFSLWKRHINFQLWKVKNWKENERNFSCLKLLNRTIKIKKCRFESRRKLFFSYLEVKYKSEKEKSWWLSWRWALEIVKKWNKIK